MSFSVSDSRSVAANMRNPRSAIRIASRIFSTSPGSFTARSASTAPSIGTNVTFGASCRRRSRVPTVIRFPSTPTDLTPAFVSTSVAASRVVLLCPRMAASRSGHSSLICSSNRVSLTSVLVFGSAA